MNMDFWTTRDRLIADTLMQHHNHDVAISELYRQVEQFIVAYQRAGITQLHADLLNVFVTYPSLAAEVMRGMHQAASHQEVEADTKEAMRIAFEHILIVAPYLDMADEAVLGIAALDNPASIPLLETYLQSIEGQQIQALGNGLIELGVYQVLEQLYLTKKEGS